MKGVQVCLNERPRPFQRGDNWEIIKINRQLFKIFFSRTTRPISTKLGTKYPLVKGIPVCSNEESRPSQRGDNWEIVKLIENFLNLLLQNHWANFNQTWQSILGSNEGSSPSQSGDNCKILKIHYWKLFKVLSAEPLGHFQPNLAESIRFNFFLYEVPTPSQRGNNYKIVIMHRQIFKSPSPELLDKFYLNLPQSLLEWRGLFFLKLRTKIFFKKCGDNCKAVKSVTTSKKSIT